MQFKSKPRDNAIALPVADCCLAVAGRWRRGLRMAIAGDRERDGEHSTGPEKINMKKRVHILAALAGLMVSSTAMAALTLQDDVDKNRQSDIFFSGGSSLAYWTSELDDFYDFYDGSLYFNSRYAGDGGASYRVVAVSDFDGDRSADVLWANATQLKLWINNGSGGYTPVPAGTFGGSWEPFAARDLNGDGKSDILFRKGSELVFRLMDGAKILQDNYFGDGGPGYQVIALDDFDADGVADVLWSNGSQLKVWRSRAGHATSVIANYGGGWEAFAGGDINRDGVADILFRNGTHIAYWLMNANSQVNGIFYGGDGGPGFRVIAVSNYFGPGGVQILWADGSRIKLWYYDNYNKPDGFHLYSEFVGPTSYVSHVSYGGGWQPLSLLIPQ